MKSHQENEHEEKLVSNTSIEEEDISEEVSDVVNLPGLHHGWPRFVCNQCDFWTISTMGVKLHKNYEHRMPKKVYEII